MQRNGNYIEANSRKGGPKWSILGFWSSDELASDLDVADMVSFFAEIRIRNAV